MLLSKLLANKNASRRTSFSLATFRPPDRPYPKDMRLPSLSRGRHAGLTYSKDMRNPVNRRTQGLTREFILAERGRAKHRISGLNKPHNLFAFNTKQR